LDAGVLYGKDKVIAENIKETPGTLKFSFVPHREHFVNSLEKPIVECRVKNAESC